MNQILLKNILREMTVWKKYLIMNVIAKDFLLHTDISVIMEEEVLKVNVLIVNGF